MWWLGGWITALVYSGWMIVPGCEAEWCEGNGTGAVRYAVLEVV